MTVESGDDLARSRCWRRVGFLVVSQVLLLVFGGFSVLLGLVIGSAKSASCISFDDRPICSEWGEVLALVLSAGGLISGLLLAGIAGIIALRRDREISPWVMGGWGVFITSIIFSLALSGGEPSEEAQQRADEQRAREARQERVSWLADLRRRPDLEQHVAQMDEMQARIDSELREVVPGISWPQNSDVSDYECTSYGVAAKRVDGQAVVPATPVMLSRWGDIATVVGRVAGEYGFTVDETSESEPYNLLFTNGVGAERVYKEWRLLRVALDRGELKVSVLTPCHVPAAERARIPPR